MAFVLEVTERESSAPFSSTETYSTTRIKDKSYVCTKNTLYSFDGINNIYNVEYTFPSNINHMGIISLGDYIYTVNGNYISRYDIVNRVYTSQWYHWRTSYTANIRYIISWYSSDGNSINFIFKYSHAGSSYYTRQWIIVDSDGTVTLKSAPYAPITQQISNNYFFGNTYESGPSSYENRQFGIIQDEGTFSILGTNNIAIGFNGSFSFGDNIYLPYYQGNMYVFSKLSNSFTETNYSFTVEKQRYVITGDDNTYYIQGTDKLYTIKFVEYDLTYKITNNNGLQIYKELLQQTPINKVTFNYNDTNVGYVFSTLSGLVTGSFEIETPANNILSGFTAVNDFIRFDIPLNTETEISIKTNTTFYAIFTPYRPIDTRFEISVYKNSAEPHRVDKTNHLEEVGTLLGAFRDTVNIVNPIIRIEGDIPTYNYIYIGKLNRYYYVTDYDIVRTGLIDLYLTEDVLMTYREGIYKLKAFVERNEYENNPLLVDKKRIIEEGIDVEVHSIENALMSETLFQPETDIRFVLNGYKIDSADESPV